MSLFLPGIPTTGDPGVYKLTEFTYNDESTATISIEDANGCISEPIPPVNVTVWKIPETGPQYHIPNTFGE